LGDFLVIALPQGSFQKDTDGIGKASELRQAGFFECIQAVIDILPVANY
jgi:hypothetical protein